MERFQLELIYLYFPPSYHQIIFDVRTVENKDKLILTRSRSSKQSTLKPVITWPGHIMLYIKIKLHKLCKENAHNRHHCKKRNAAETQEDPWRCWWTTKMRLKQAKGGPSSRKLHDDSMNSVDIKLYHKLWAILAFLFFTKIWNCKSESYYKELDPLK